MIKRARRSGIQVLAFRYLCLDLILLAVFGILHVAEIDQQLSLLQGSLLALVALSLAVGQMRAVGYNWASAPLIYLLYMAAYHLLFIVPAALFDDFAYSASYRPETGIYAYWIIDWIFTPGARIALLLTASACLGVALGSLLVVLFSRTHGSHRETFDEQGNPDMFRIGLLLQVLAVLILLYALVSGGGWNLLLADYRTIRDVLITTNLFAQVNLLFGVSAVISLASASKEHWRLPFYLFGAAALPLFFTGNRGEVLYPLLVLFVMLYRRGSVLPRSLVVAGLAAVFLLVPVAYQIRTVGLGQIDQLNFLDFQRAFIDLGFSLRPVETVATWILRGDSFLSGASYWLPFERVLARFFPFIWQQGDVLTDVRFVATQTFLRTGAPMGFSVIAEAYYNFGFIGPPLVLAIIGSLLAWLHKMARNSVCLAFLGIVMLPLVNNVRNSFIFVPGQIAIGVGLLLIATQWHRFRRGGKRSVSRSSSKGHRHG
jgi:oligosaccharide repeat unit polymerase